MLKKVRQISEEVNQNYLCSSDKLVKKILITSFNCAKRKLVALGLLRKTLSSF